MAVFSNSTYLPNTKPFFPQLPRLIMKKKSPSRKKIIKQHQPKQTMHEIIRENPSKIHPYIHFNYQVKSLQNSPIQQFASTLLFPPKKNKTNGSHFKGSLAPVPVIASQGAQSIHDLQAVGDKAGVGSSHDLDTWLG